MRHPKTSFMTRTFELAQKCLGLKMLPYIRVNENAFLSFNNFSVIQAANKKNNLIQEDMFKVSVTSNGDVPETYFKDGVDVFWGQIVGDLRQYFVDKPFPIVFEKLKKWEDHSITSYLLLEEKIPHTIVKWWETMNSRTGLFDQSLVKTLLASLVFMGPNSTDHVDWLCFEFVRRFNQFIDYSNLFNTIAVVPKFFTRPSRNASAPNLCITCAPSPSETVMTEKP